jgi:hypothetical protein
VKTGRPWWDAATATRRSEIPAWWPSRANWYRARAIFYQSSGGSSRSGSTARSFSSA